MTTSITNVATYIAQRLGNMPTMKLHKLAFYAQAAYLIQEGVPLFPEDFKACIVGPVSPKLMHLQRMHRQDPLWTPNFPYEGIQILPSGKLPYGDASALTDTEKNLIIRICTRMCDMTGNELTERVRQEEPWIQAWERHTATHPLFLDLTNPRMISDETISKEAMLVYYSQHPILQ